MICGSQGSYSVYRNNLLLGGNLVPRPDYAAVLVAQSALSTASVASVSAQAALSTASVASVAAVAEASSAAAAQAALAEASHASVASVASVASAAAAAQTTDSSLRATHGFTSSPTCIVDNVGPRVLGAAGLVSDAMTPGMSSDLLLFRGLPGGWTRVVRPVLCSVSSRLCRPLTAFCLTASQLRRMLVWRRPGLD